MSAESPRKSNRQGSYVVAPQPVTDRSIIESVAGFINEVVPQGYSGPGIENKETVITWARFEQADINDPGLYPDSVDEPTRAPPLLLILGYANGVQVWAVPASGEATEVLSWRQGVVRTLRILPTPPTGDAFAPKRPLVALCDTASPGPQFCSLSFISLRAGDQVKSIKFKNPVMAVLANIRCIVVTFLERIAVFDAGTLEDRFTVTTCYPSPGVNVNPVALGSRWLAYAERRLSPSKRCSGGTEGEGIQSYTATVLHAAKSLSKGLRELGETVASSLTGAATPPAGRGLPDNVDFLNPGIVTILDIRGTPKESGRVEENVVAHFNAHADAIVAMQFDPSGMLLATADKRGHDFHMFRIQPHPGGSSLAAVHHLYVLHRGDTTAKVQDLVFAWDSRWLAVSTLRGTTHVFPVTPYGGAVGLRTHSTPHVVNRLSRFHRSAGLTADGRNSPQPSEGGASSPHHPAMAHSNPRLPPYPHPTVVTPLAQIRQSQPAPVPPSGRSPSTRRSHALDESGTVPLRVSACFGAPRAWLVGSPTAPRDSSTKARRRAVDSLFIMACHGNLIQYDLETKHASGIPKEKVCDDTPIELDVEAKAQWTLGGLLRVGGEVQPPLPLTSLLITPPGVVPVQATDHSDERWLSQVEIVTHAGPHRRLWMGPQFTFKTYAQPSIEPDDPASRIVRSNPVNMPQPPIVPVLIESGSGSSYEQSPHLVEACGPGDVRLREDLADAMLESPGAANRHAGRRVIVEICSGKRSRAIPVEKIVNPVGSVLTVVSEDGHSDGTTGDQEKEEATVRWPTDVMRADASPSEVNLSDACDDIPSVSVVEIPLETSTSVTKLRNQPIGGLTEKCDKNRSRKKSSSKEKDKSSFEVTDMFCFPDKPSTKEVDILLSKTLDSMENMKAPSEGDTNVENTIQSIQRATKKQGRKSYSKKADSELIVDIDSLKEEITGGKKDESLSVDLLTKAVLETNSFENCKQECTKPNSEPKIIFNSKDRPHKEKKPRSPLKSVKDVKEFSELNISSLERANDELLVSEGDIECDKSDPEIEFVEKMESRVTSRARKYQGLDFVNINHSVQDTNLKEGSKKKLKMFEIPENFLMEVDDSSESVANQETKEDSPDTLIASEVFIADETLNPSDKGAESGQCESSALSSKDKLGSAWSGGSGLSWSSVASCKKKEEVTATKTWSTIVKSSSADNGSSTLEEVKVVEPEEEEETSSSLQASKKSRKVKKKRR